jgi:hypothetical protein
MSILHPIDGAQVAIGSPWPIITYVGFKFFMLSFLFMVFAGKY